jgi:acyl-CoA thioesterase II
MLNGLVLRTLGPGRYEAPHVEGHGGGRSVFGAQLLAQMVVAASQELEGKPLTSLHAVFARPAELTKPVFIDVDVLHQGRSAGSATISVHQGGPVAARGVALTLAPQRDLVHHSTAPPPLGRPADATPINSTLLDMEVRVVGGADLADLRGGDPPELHLWIRTPAGPDGPVAAKAMLAYASEPFFVAAALRPHEGISQAMVYTTFTPAVVSHSMAFHDASFQASDWLLFAIASPQVAAGRVFGRADVFTERGAFVASVWQENLLRPLPA